MSWWVNHDSEGERVSVGPFRQMAFAYTFRQMAFADPEYGEVAEAPDGAQMRVADYCNAFRCSLNFTKGTPPSEGWHNEAAPAPAAVPPQPLLLDALRAIRDREAADLSRINAIRELRAEMVDRVRGGLGGVHTLASLRSLDAALNDDAKAVRKMADSDACDIYQAAVTLGLPVPAFDADTWREEVSP